MTEDSEPWADLADDEEYARRHEAWVDLMVEEEYESWYDDEDSVALGT
jgi:hypothetical protein